ncbi:MAG: hypothetical protein RMN51_03965 [Verrucomicrobiota bacterium]|nr:hypothetical protein [Limisphaera sp.]MDW8381253.1 hypothetical protein [Verrucomicrobiota bacterium]
MVRIHAGQPHFLQDLYLMNDWRIQARASHCQECGRGFTDGQPYHSMLWAKPGHYRRQDVCPQCWTQHYRQQARTRPDLVSYWRGLYEAPPSSSEPMPHDAVEELLRQLCQRQDARYWPAVYILAVMMERRRLLRVKEQFWRQGQRVFVYEHVRTGEAFTVPDPALKLSELGTVQRLVAHLLENGLPAQDGKRDSQTESRPVETTGLQPAETGASAHG